MEILDITTTDVQFEIIGLIIIEEYKKELSKRMKNGKYMDNSAGYTSSIFQDFEKYLTTESDLLEDDIRLVF